MKLIIIALVLLLHSLCSFSQKLFKTTWLEVNTELKNDERVKNIEYRHEGATSKILAFFKKDIRAQYWFWNDKFYHLSYYMGSNEATKKKFEEAIKQPEYIKTPNGYQHKESKVLLFLEKEDDFGRIWLTWEGVPL